MSHLGNDFVSKSFAFVSVAQTTGKAPPITVHIPTSPVCATSNHRPSVAHLATFVRNGNLVATC